MVTVVADVRCQPVLPHAHRLELVIHSLVSVEHACLQEAQRLCQLLHQMKTEPLSFILLWLRVPLVLSSAKELKGVLYFLRRLLRHVLGRLLD